MKRATILMLVTACCLGLMSLSLSAYGDAIRHPIETDGFKNVGGISTLEFIPHSDAGESSTIDERFWPFSFQTNYDTWQYRVYVKAHGYLSIYPEPIAEGEDGALTSIYLATGEDWLDKAYLSAVSHAIDVEVEEGWYTFPLPIEDTPYRVEIVSLGVLYSTTMNLSCDSYGPTLFTGTLVAFQLTSQSVQETLEERHWNMLQSIFPSRVNSGSILAVGSTPATATKLTSDQSYPDKITTTGSSRYYYFIASADKAYCNIFLDLSAFSSNSDYDLIVTTPSGKVIKSQRLGNQSELIRINTEKNQRVNIEVKNYSNAANLNYLIRYKEYPITSPYICRPVTSGNINWFKDMGGATTWFGTSGIFTYSGHKGCDYGVSNATVKAATSGTIYNHGTDHSYNTWNTNPPISTSRGIWVEVKDSSGRISRYLHLSSHAGSLYNGMPVSAGSTTLGISGNTGYSEGPHLHFDITNASGTLVEPHADNVDYLPKEYWIEVNSAVSGVWEYVKQ